MTCQKTQTVIGLVTAIADNHADITLQAPQQQSCKQCQNQGGCQSFSLYHLLFAKRPIVIENRHYQLGQQLRLTFPNHMILQSVAYLLGLPLLGFVGGVMVAVTYHELAGFALGLCLATFGGGYGRKVTRQSVIKKLIINKD